MNDDQHLNPPEYYTERLGEANTLNGLVRRLSHMPETARYEFIHSLLDRNDNASVYLGVRLANRCLRDVKLLDLVLLDFIQRRNWRYGRLYLEQLTPRLGSRRILKALTKAAAEHPHKVARARLFFQNRDGAHVSNELAELDEAIHKQGGYSKAEPLDDQV
jgi:hypothetical protein